MIACAALGENTNRYGFRDTSNIFAVMMDMTCENKTPKQQSDDKGDHADDERFQHENRGDAALPHSEREVNAQFLVPALDQEIVCVEDEDRERDRDKGGKYTDALDHHVRCSRLVLAEVHDRLLRVYRN